MSIKLPEGLTGKKLYDFLVENKESLLLTKKAETKHCDAVSYTPMYIDRNGKLSTKADPVEVTGNPTKIEVVCIINTIGWFDSHSDVHIPDMWNQSVKQNKGKGFPMLNQHRWGLENIVAKGCKAEIVTKSWRELGVNAQGTTQCLQLTAIIEKTRWNQDVFDMYLKGWIDQHSVGMRYVTLHLCINDEDYKEEYANWNQYIGYVINADDAIENGYFYAVTEGKVVEGSPVSIGSNIVTPTESVTPLKGLNNQEDSTHDGPPLGTHDGPQKSDWIAAINKYQFT